MKTAIAALSLLAVAMTAAVSTQNSPVRIYGVGVWDGRPTGAQTLLRSSGNTVVRENTKFRERHIAWICFEQPPENQGTKYDVILRALDVLSHPDWSGEEDVKFWNDVKKLPPADAELRDAVDSLTGGENIWTARAYRDTNDSTHQTYVALELTKTERVP